jgi:Phospholipid methyltransferase
LRFHPKASPASTSPFTEDCDGNVVTFPGHPAAACSGDGGDPWVDSVADWPHADGRHHSAVRDGRTWHAGPVEPDATARGPGVYRHVRNPMISGVLFVLLGEAAVAASSPLASWFLLFVIINAVYIPLSEEPGLAKRFGDDYLTYKQNVPRWVPRLRPWRSDPPCDDTIAS